MNFKNIFFIVFIITSCSVFSQDKNFQKPNYKKIKKAITKKKSEFYYPKLMKQFLKSVTKMTLKEKRFLYYGFVFRKEYQPYAESKYKPIIRKLLQKSRPSTTDLEELVRQADSHLYYHPFDIEVLRVKVYAYKKMRNKEFVKKSRNQIAIIKEVLLSSGNGKTKKSAFHVININHEYELLKMLSYKQKGRRNSFNKYEYLKLEPNKDHIDGLYFNLIQSAKSINE